MSLDDVLKCLSKPRFLASEVPGKPGLYAVYGEPDVWEELGLGAPPDNRPLYVGKAEKSLRSRKFLTHFSGGDESRLSPTGSSTLRRSLAALLKERFGFNGLPRHPAKPGYFSNFGLSASDDQKLARWMTDSLRVAAWCLGSEVLVELGVIESEVLIHWKPPLNLKDVETPWKSMVKRKRARLADEARSWANVSSPTPPKKNRGPRARKVEKSSRGRAEFTEEEADEIKELLRRKSQADAKTQRAIRRRLRQLGLFIGQYSSRGRFSSDDFQRLVEQGDFKVH